MTAAPRPAVVETRPPAAVAIGSVASSRFAVPVALYLLALVVGIAAASTVVFPTNEGSAYYVAVARNLAAGRGLVIDSIWSYATPPLVLPRPAFELWQPLASFIAAVPMALLGGTFAAAQVGGVVVGAGVAPLAWAITREAARSTGTAPARIDHLAIGAGVVSALIAPVLLAVAVPDSTLAFLAFGALACAVAPRVITGGARWGLALGVCLGLAYLARLEAIYIAVLIVPVVAVGQHYRPARILRALGPVVVGGLIVVGPWLLRNLAVFGSVLPGQALDNALLTSNEQIYEYGTRPTVDAFLAQGVGGIVGSVVSGTIHNVVDVAVLPGMPVSLIGIAGAVWLARRGGLRYTGLWFLLASGVLTLAVDSLLFPVASQWGTFLHASGPLLIGLVIAAVLATDRLVDAVRLRRGWQRANAWLAPLALALVAVPMSILQLQLLDGGTPSQRAYTVLARTVAQQPEIAAAEAAGRQPVLISDHPIWLNETSGLPTLALPAEAPDVVLRLAHDFGASLIVVAEGRGNYPAGFRGGQLGSCFIERPLPVGAPAGAALFVIAEGCP